MTRRELARAIALGFLGTTPAFGQDFGRFLEEKARAALREKLDPKRLDQALAPRQDGELMPVRTPDGWTLVVHRYRPAPAPSTPRLPVVLAHGLTYRAGFWDLEPSVSFARWLSQRGWDVWAVDWRGCGLSQKWVFRLDDAPEVVFGEMIRKATHNRVTPTGYASIDPRYANWTLDDHVDQDLPTVLRLVLKSTGAPQVFWVGHSMGGIIPLCHLAKYPNPGIARLATVGSQVTMPRGGPVLAFLQQLLFCRELQLGGKLRADELASRTQEGIQNLFFNVQHVSRSVYEALASDRTDIPAIGLMRQYHALATGGELWDAPRRVNYAQAVKNVQVPILMTCGAADSFAPPSVQKYLFDHVGSADKTALAFGRARGFAADSGHDDALVGLTSMREVYPVIERWLLGQRLG